MNNCNVIPIVSSTGMPSQVFQTTLNFSKALSPTVISEMGIGANTIRDLATYLYKYTDSLGNVPGLSRYEMSGEIKLENVLASLLNKADMLNLNETARNTFRYMLDQLNQKVSNIYDPSIRYAEGFNSSDISYSNKVLTQAYLQVQEALQNKTIKNGISLKVAVLNQLNKNINANNQVRDAYRDRFVEDYLFNLMKQDSILWKSFLAYIKTTYGVNYRNIKHDITLEDTQGTFQTTEDIQEVWDAVRQDKIDRKNTISSIVKAKLAKILNDTTSSSSQVNKLYIPDPLDINTVWNQLINLHINDLTVEDIERSIMNAAQQIDSFAKIADEFEKAKRGDDEAINFRNAYISGVKLAVIPSNILSVDSKFVSNVYTNNKGAFARNAYIDRFTTVIDSNIRFGQYGASLLNNLKAESHAYLDKKRIFDLDYAIDSLMNVYNALGLAVTRRALYAYSQTSSNVEADFTRLAAQTNYIVDEIKAIKKGNVTIDAYTEQNSDNKGNLYKLAEIASYDFDSLTNLSYLDVKGELNYSPQYDSLLTKLFRGLSLNGQVRQDYLLDVFKDYLNDPTLQNDNFLFYDERTGMGMFERNKDGDFRVSDYFINRIEKGKRFAISQFDGMKLRDKGYKYRDLQSTLYKYTEVVANMLENYIFLTSDSPRSYMMSIQHIPTDDLFNSDGTINNKAKMFNALQKIVQTDVDIFYNQGAVIFGIDTTKDGWLDDARKYHAVKYWNGKEIIDKNGIPTGKAFQFKTLTYNENQKPVSIVDYISQELEVPLSQVYAGLISGDIDLQSYVPAFVARYIQYSQESVINDFSDIAKYILETNIEEKGQVINLLGDELANEIEANYNNRLNNFLENNTNENIKTVDDVWQSTKDKLYDAAKEEVLANTDVANSEAYKNGMLRIILNHTVYSNSFNNIINGKLSEYKNTTDYNKRIAQIIKNGLNSVQSNHQRRILIMDDLNFKNNIAGQLFNEVRGVNQVGRVNDTIADLYGGFTTINDSMSIMTDVALENLLKSTGRWEEFASIVNNLRNESQPFNPVAYRKLVEQLKLFGTARRRRGDFFKADTAIRDEQGNIVNNDFANEVDSIQVKDSTIVLFKSTTRGMAMGEMYDWMVDNQVDQISPISAVKVSGITPMKIHNDNAQLVLPSVPDDLHMLYMESSDFVIQQDVKADILDKSIILGNQLVKQITQGLDMVNPIYNLDGQKVTGETIFKELQTAVSNKIREDALNLLNDLGGIDENGNVNVDQNGDIVLSTPKLVKMMQEIVEDDDSSTNIKEALTLDDLGLPTLPLSHPVTYKKFEKILAARFSKRVINQYMPGLHAPLRADIFNAPNMLLDKTNTLIQGSPEYDAAINNLVQNGSITYSADFIAKCKAEGRSLELRAEFGYDENGQLINRAEVIMNPWLKEMFNTLTDIRTVDMGNGVTKEFVTVDINQIPQEAREMLAIRIPTEGKQSMVLFEVVGFLNTGATQAIFPQSLVTQTGWDFDIDTIYAYYKHVNFSEGIYTVPKFDANREAQSAQNQLNFYATQSAALNKYKSQIIEPTANSSLNSKAFMTIAKAFVNMYNSREANTNSINELRTNVDNAIAILGQQQIRISKANITGGIEIEDAIKKLKQVRSALNIGIVNMLNETTVNVNEALNIANYNNASIETMQQLLGRELTQEDRLRLSRDMNNNYQTADDNHLYDILTKANQNMQTVRNTMRRLESIVNSINVVSGDIKYGLHVDEANALKQPLAKFISGDVTLVNPAGQTREINIYDQLNKLNENINKTVGLPADFTVQMDDLGKQINRDSQARDNRILDIATAILGNEYHINETNKPNAMDNIQRASQRDNSLWNRSLDTLNPNNLADKIFLNVVSMGSTVLKGHSVNFDNTAAILSTINANLKSGISRLIHISDLPYVKDSKGKPIMQFTTAGNLTNEYRQYLTDIYGKDNFKFIKSRNALQVNDKWINNNAVGTNLDLAGDKVSFQLSEVTSAILDILKAGLMFNLNTDTLSVFRLLSAGATTELYYDPRNPTATDRKANRFSFASAFIQQPAIVEVVQTINRELISDDYFNYTKAVGYVADTYSRKLIDFYNNNKTELATVHDDIQKLANKKGLIRLSKTQVASILRAVPTSENFYYSQDATNNYTTRELLGFIQNRDVVSADQFASQLAILNLFENYNSKAEDLTQLSFVLKTEGRVDSFYKADSKEAKLADYYMSKENYNKLLKDTLKNSFEKVNAYAVLFNSDPLVKQKILSDFDHMTTDAFYTNYKERIPSMQRRGFITKASFYQAKSEFVNLITVNDRRAQVDYLDLEYSPNAGFEVQGKDLIDLIFTGSQFDYIDKNTNQFVDNTATSAYPIIQARYQFGHWLFANSFDKVFAQRAQSIRKAVSTFLLDNNHQYDEQSRSYVEGKLIEYYTQRTGENMTPIFANLSVQQRQNLLGIFDQEVRDEHQSIAKELFGKINNDVTNEKLAKFAKLSMAEQIKFIQTEPSLKAYINRPDFKRANIFNLIQIDKNGRNTYGYDIIRIISDDNNIVGVDDIRNSISYMFNSDIPYIAHSIRNLIAYTYYTNGFQYGYNLAKYIPTELFANDIANPSYDTRILQAGLADPTVGLSDYSYNLRAAENAMIQGETFDIDTALGYISRQQPNLIVYAPSYNQQNILDNTNVNIATIGLMRDESGQNVGSVNVTDGDGNDRVMIFETRERVNNSRYANNKYVTKRRGRNVILYQRSEPFNHNSANPDIDVYVYYPIGKLLKNEFTENSIVDSFNVSQEISIGDNGQTMDVISYAKQSGELAVFLNTIEQRKKNQTTSEEVDNLAIDDSGVEEVNEDYDVNTEYDDVVADSLDTPEFSQYVPIQRNAEVTTTNEGFINLSNRLIETSDNVVLITDATNDNFQNNQYSRNPKTITVNLQNSPIREAQRIAKQLNDGSIHLYGNIDYGAKINSKQAMQWTQIFLSKLYEYRGNISEVSTILNNNIGMAIANSHIDTNRVNYSTTDNVEVLQSQFVKINKPINDSFESKVIQNAAIAADSYRTIRRVIRQSERQIIPNIDNIKDAFRSLGQENFQGGIITALTNNSFEATQLAFRKMVSINISLIDAINEFITEIKATDVNSIRNDYYKFQEYKQKLSLLAKLVSTFEKFKNLQPIDIKDTTYDGSTPEGLQSFDDEFGNVNESIATLMDLYKQSLNARNTISDFIQELQVEQVIADSRNPAYATAFSRILEASRKADFDPNTFDASTLNITESEWRDIVSKVFTLKNQDINGWQTWLDSAFVTGVTLIDITGKQYIKAVEAAKRKAEGIKDRVDEALERRDPKLLTSPEYRAEYFKRFVTPTGDLIDTYNTGKTLEDLRTLKSLMFDIIQREWYGSSFYVSDSQALDIIKQMNTAINEFNIQSDAVLVRVPTDKLTALLATLEDMTNNEREAYLKLNGYVELNYITEVGNAPEKTIFKLDYKESAKDANYAALDKADQKFIQEIKDLIQETIQEYNPTYVPYSSQLANVLPYLPQSSLQEQFKSYFRMPRIRQDQTYEAIDGTKKYYLEAHTLSTPEFNALFRVPERNLGEAWSDYEDRVVNQFERWYNPKRNNIPLTNPVKNIKDIREFNRKTAIENKTKKAQNMSYDIRDIMKAFTEELFNIKAVNDFQTDYDLALFSLKENNGEEHLRNSMKQFDNLQKRVYNTSKIHGAIDVASSALLRYSSINYMYLNYTAGIKNVLKGVSDMLIEISSDSYVDAKSVRQGLAEIIKVVPEWIQHIRTGKTDNLNVAIVQNFEDVYQDTRDIYSSLTGTGFLTKALSTVDSIGYSPNTMGEFVMQFGMLLACVKSHKVVGGRVISFGDFYDQEKSKILSNILTPDQIKEYYAFKEAKNKEIERYEKRKGHKYNWEGDYVGEFLRFNPDLLTAEQKKEYVKQSKANKEAYREMFNKLPSLEESLEVVNGRLAAKEGSELTTDSLTEFRERVKGINQALHGIYNRVDRMALQDTALGELFAQFRKWMRPNWVRYFGRRFNQTFFNETLGSWETPIYKPFFDWTKYGYDMWKKDNPYYTTADVFKGSLKILAYQVKSLKQASYYYHTLPASQQAAVRKWAQHVATVSTVMVAAIMLGRLKDDDPELKDSTAYALLNYEMSAWFKEVVEPVPIYGWWSTATSVQESTFVGEKILVNALKLGQYTLKGVFSDDESLYYDRGIYKGQHKRDVALRRVLPIINQIQKQKNLAASANLYDYYNPFN